MNLDQAPQAPQISRQRIDYEELPDGGVRAILTITFPGGVTKQYTYDASASEIETVEGEIVGAEYAILARRGDVVGWNLFKSIAKAAKGVVKTVGKVAKSVASSGVFKVAASGLALAAPVLGPLAPAALAVSAGMGVASKLAKAGGAVAKGAKSVAAAFTKDAAREARKITSSKASAASLLSWANKRRIGAQNVPFLSNVAKKRARPKRKPSKREVAEALSKALRKSGRRLPKIGKITRASVKKAHAKIAKRNARRKLEKQCKPLVAKLKKQNAKLKKKCKCKTKTRTITKWKTRTVEKPVRVPVAPQYAPMSEADLLARARAGRVRSNSGVAVPESQLLAANKQGRIFWVQ